jgi:hypothetical protein
MLWKTLNIDQLAHETRICKDPLCQRPHHQILMDYHSTLNTWKSLDMKPCPHQNSKHGSTMILMPQPCMGVSPHQQDILAPSPRHHLTVPRFVAEPRPKDTIPKSHARPLRKTFPIWCQHMACQQLAVDVAHALLSGVSSHSHPLSLKYRSPAQSPPDPRTPGRAAVGVITDQP